MSLRPLPPVESVIDPVKYAELLVKSARSCAYFVEQFIGFKVFDYNKAFLDNYDRFIVYRTGRQVGKSTNAALKAIHFAFFAPLFASNIDTGVANVVIASLSKDQAHLILSKISEFIHMSPTLSKKIIKEIKTEMTLEWYNGEGKTNFIVRPIGDTGDSLRGFCIKKGEYIYTKMGIIKVENVKDNYDILGGNVSHIHEFEDEIYKISFKNGASLNVNSEHKFYTKDGWKEAVKLTSDDFVEFKQSEYFDLDSKSIGNEMAKFMGYLFSDGSFGTKCGQHVSFSNINKNILNDIESLFYSLYPDMTIHKKYNKPRNFGKSHYYKYTFSNNSKGKIINPLKQYIRENNIIKSSLGIFTQLNKEETISFIQGVFTGDGSLSITKNIPEIDFAMGIYEQVAYEFQYILWKIGVSSHITKQNNCYYVKLRNSNDVSNLINILDDIKYPQKFAIAKQILNNKKHRIKYDKFAKISKIEKIGKSTVIGFEVTPTHEIYSYLGMRTHNTSHYAILDEAAYIPQVVFDAFLPSTVTTKPHILVTSTPKGKAGFFFSACMSSHTIYEKGKPRPIEGHENKEKYPWTQFHVTTFDNPLAASDPQVLKLIRGTTKAAEKQEIYGEFLDGGNSLIPYNLLQEALQPVERPKFDYYDCGVDTSGKGADETVITIAGVRDGILYPIDVYTELTTEQPALARKIQEFHRIYGFRRIYIDETGMGDTLMDLCKEYDPTMPVIGINFKSDKTALYVNLERLFEEENPNVGGIGRLINLSLLEDYHKDKMVEQLSYMHWDHGKYKDQQPKVRSDHADDYSDSLALVGMGQQKLDFIQDLNELFVL